MPKLFIAANLPEGTHGPITALLGAHPASATGLRLTHPEQMHITLGDADVERVRAALERCQRTPFALTMSGVGEFGGRDGTSTLWAGVVPCRALSALHAAVAEALAPTWQ